MRIVATLIVLLFFGVPSLLWADAPLQLAYRHQHQLDDGKLVTSLQQPALIERALERLEHRIQLYSHDHEAHLLKGLIYFKLGKVDEALNVFDELITRAPKFHLAHLLRGDLLLSRTQGISDVGANSLLVDSDREQLSRLRDEVQARLMAYLDVVEEARIPAEILALGKSVKTAVVVDKSEHRLYIYENVGSGNPPLLLRDFYASTGKLEGNKQLRGDLKTPEGVYFVTSYLDDEKLPSKYGTGAFPLNYPNEIDHVLGKTGSGIWLHGTDKAFYSRPPLDSEGCVVLTNLDLNEISPYIHPGVTPVVIVENIRWIDKASWKQRHAELMQSLEQWRRDWQSMDVERYLSHYDQDFWSKGHNLNSWKSYKSHVFSNKQYQTITLHDVSLFEYPSLNTQRFGERLVVANYRQQYRSNNFNRDSRKRLYLSHRGDAWKLIYEGGQ